MEEGVKIICVYENMVEYIVVKEGGKMNGVGRGEKGMVMRREKEEGGGWGGIDMWGKGDRNGEGGKGS